MRRHHYDRGPGYLARNILKVYVPAAAFWGISRQVLTRNKEQVGAVLKIFFNQLKSNDIQIYYSYSMVSLHISHLQPLKPLICFCIFLICVGTCQVSIGSYATDDIIISKVTFSYLELQYVPWNEHNSTQSYKQKIVYDIYKSSMCRYSRLFSLINLRFHLMWFLVVNK